VKVSTRGRYGMRALLELAGRNGGGPVFLKDIACRQDISLSYLERLFSDLVKGGIIRSTKGPKGGVSLAKDPADIRLSEVILLLEGSVSPTECVDNPDCCERSPYCVTRDIWKQMREAVDDVLESTTLQDLVERQMKKQGAGEEMYYI
jgi:Rrf2 family cysteine metabolism transcriptional repressor